MVSTTTSPTPRELEAPTLVSVNDIGDLADDLGGIRLSNLIRNHDSNSITTRDESGLRNTATVYREVIESKFSFDLEKDLSNLLQPHVEDMDATHVERLRPMTSTQTRLMAPRLSSVTIWA
jgi:hypothetical protein